MEDIKTHVIRGYKSLPGRGAEIGGVLLGSFDPGTGDPATREIVIDAFEPMQIDYRSGPSYIPSADDYAQWRDWVLALREASPRIVGICRSHTRPGLRVATEDGNLIGQVMPGGDGVLLLVKPLSDRECVGAFFPFRQGIVTDGSTPSREFPFGARQPVELPARKPQPLSRWIVISAIAAGIAAAAVLHYMTEAPEENPLVFQSKPRSKPPAAYPINSSSDTRETKPSPAAPASAQTGGDAIKSQRTSQATHLWPSHSVRQAPPTQ
jgi:hypothetical protein